MPPNPYYLGTVAETVFVIPAKAGIQTVRNGFRIKVCPEQTKACPELAEALSVVEGVAEWADWVRNDNNSNHA